MTEPHRQGPPRSTLADFMGGIVDRLNAAGYGRSELNPGGIELLVGERYLRQEGAPPRLVLVRTTGTAGPPLRVGDGNVASISQGVTAYLWGAETTDDVGRYAAQDTLVDEVINTVRAIAPGRTRVTTINPLVESNVLTFGEELQILIEWTRSVPRDAAIWAVETTPVSPPDPMRPNGDTGDTPTLDLTTEGTR